MHPRILLLIAVFGILLVACERPEGPSGLDTWKKNPLMEEAIADQMIDYVTLLQIRANDRKQPITDPAVLRAIDETFLQAREMLKEAHERQDQGKSGGLHAVGDNFVKGEVLLLGTKLYVGYDFDTDAVPGLRVILAQHVGPATEQDLKSEPTLDLGPLKTILGPHEYEVGQLSGEEWDRYRTVVLYSPPFKSIIAYAQIRKKVEAGEGEQEGN